jgi:hypothetical protein
MPSKGSCANHTAQALTDVQAQFHLHGDQLGLTVVSEEGDHA